MGPWLRPSQRSGDELFTTIRRDAAGRKIGGSAVEPGDEVKLAETSRDLRDAVSPTNRAVVSAFLRRARWCALLREERDDARE